MGKLAERIWISCTLLLIATLHVTPQLYIIPYQPLSILFNFLLFLLYYNYYLCVTTNPGEVPKGWKPDPATENSDAAIEVKKLTGGPRYCRTCRAYKPPRSHHCRKCGKCILKMDHHCPWVSNCVGHANYGHFIRFLFFVDVSCSLHLYLITSASFSSQALQTEPTVSLVLALVVNYILCGPVLIAVGCFSLYHFWCVGVNTTTIEGWEKDKAATLLRRGKIREYKYPYDLGYLANFRAVLGPYFLLWCMPQKMEGDGLRYPVGRGVDPLSQYTWPPKDEFLVPYSTSRASRHRLADSTPFTYGEGLNPSLTQNAVRHRPKKSRLSPFHPDYSPPPSDDEDEEEKPLAELMKDRAGEGFGRHVDPKELPEDEQDQALGERVVRVRRGSEGFEIRPKLYHVFEPEQDSGSEVSQSESEDSVDQFLDNWT